MSSDYWEKRAIERMLDLELYSTGYAQRITDIYAAAFQQLEEDLQDLLGRYMEMGELSPEEARAYLNEPITTKQRGKLLAMLGAVEDETVRRRLLARIQSNSYTARAQRLRAIQDNLRIACARVAEQEITQQHKALRDIGANAYYRTVFDIAQGTGTVVPFSDVRMERIDALAAQRWCGPDFSSRVWANTGQMAKHLGEIIRVNLITGKSWQRCLKEMEGFMATPGQGGLFAAERLLRTETARMANELSAEASQDLGAERYRFIAVLDLKTSEVCRLHDGLTDPDTGRPYTYKRKKVGKNFPPLHPLCRSTEAPIFGADTLKGLTRPAQDPATGEIMSVPASMTYRQWHRKYVQGRPEAELTEKMVQHTAADRQQWVRYKGALGKDAPKSLAEFQRLKYTENSEWRLVQVDYRRQKQLQEHPETCLPLARNATAAPEKFTRYLFDPSSEGGYPKGQTFEKVLGYGRENWEQLQAALLEKAPMYPTTLKGRSQYGAKYEQPMVLLGPSGRRANVIAAWCSNEGKTWLTSAYIKELKQHGD
ncbi:MAG: minor capsid protein [Candidatus Pelethousia sp.]|nr:minor capsid protein [Candidatus Pelethousia sp.]